MGKVNELHEQIKEAAEHYYKGNPILTDMEFDKLLDDLKEHHPDHPILKAIGFGYMPEPGTSKVQHIGDTVGSLEKIKINNVSPDNYNCVLDKFHTVVSMPKLDGGSLVAHYEHGLLQRVLTRGDGKFGIDVTKNIYDNLPQKIENHDMRFIAIRGEAIITYEDFEGMEGSNPRNKCAGIMQSKSGHKEDLKKIKFIPYAIVATSMEVPPSSYKFLIDKKSQLDYFKENGFENIPYDVLKWENTYDMYMNVSYLPDYMMKTSDNKTCPVDGLVMSRESIDHKKSIDGMHYYYYSESIAFKYADETVKTIVESINWNLSNGGKYVPVLKIKEIEIDGVKINNVTANNYEWLSHRKCGIGAEIEVKRANEVIPNMHMVINESEDYEAPTKCEVCEFDLEIVGTDLMCTNRECPQKDVGLLYKVWQFIKPDGASDACFNIFFTDYVMYHGEDILDNMIFLLRYEIPETNNTNHYYQLVEKAIDNFRNMTVDLPSFIKMANIPTLGERIGKRIEETISFKKFTDVIKNSKDFPETIFKHAVLNDEYNFFKLEILYLLWEGKFEFKKEDKNKKEDKKMERIFKVAATGALSVPRSKWFKEMAKYNVEKVSVGKNCDYLICNEESTSSSYIKAKKLSIPILTEEAFMEIVNNENVQ